MRKISFVAALVALLLSGLPSAWSAEARTLLTYPGADGPGKGKKIVLISGDEEYRSEEALPELAAILARHHGFDCTVLFEIDPSTGQVNPEQHNNIPGFEALDNADLLIILTRFRAPPDESMKHLDDYLKAGKPVIGLRTATHAFAAIKGEYAKYNFNYKPQDDADKAWASGFGKLVLGETWVNHHGAHKSESTRGIFAPDAKDTPFVTGIKDGEIWVPTDVYGVHLPLGGDVKPIILGQVCQRAGEADNADPYYGMRPTDQPKEGDPKNNPMMPVAWTKTYQLPGGKTGKSFATTMGSSIDLKNEALRRLLVNATYTLLDMKPPEKADVAIVGDYKPSTFGFGGYQKNKKPEDFEVK